MSKLNTSHLVLKPVMVNGKTAHRWVDPHKDDKEFAPHGTKITFEHHGKPMTGTVGSVLKTGEYAVKGDNGTNYAKHKHQFDVVGKLTEENKPKAKSVEKPKDYTEKYGFKVGEKVKADGISGLVEIKAFGKTKVNVKTVRGGIDHILKVSEISKYSPEISKTEESLKSKEETKPEEKSEIKIAQEKSLENLKRELDKKKEIEEKLDNLGFAKHHRNFSALDKMISTFNEKSKEIIKLNKDKDFIFSFDLDQNWYDKRTKCSLGGYIGMDKFRLKDAFPDEYEEYRKKYPHGLSATPLEYWAAGKLEKIIKGKSNEKSEGSSGFSQSGSKMYLRIANGELQ